MKPNVGVRTSWRRKFAPTRGRGLKRRLPDHLADLGDVRPHTGAWIETSYILMTSPLEDVRPHTGAWIETANSLNLPSARASSPPHGGVD